ASSPTPRSGSEPARRAAPPTPARLVDPPAQQEEPVHRNAPSTSSSTKVDERRRPLCRSPAPRKSFNRSSSAAPPAGPATRPQQRNSEPRNDAAKQAARPPQINDHSRRATDQQPHRPPTHHQHRPHLIGGGPGNPPFPNSENPLGLFGPRRSCDQRSEPPYPTSTASLEG